MKIERGIFEGVEIPESELVPYRDEDNQPRFKADGSQAVFWPSILRTPHFLAKFSPFEGWSVVINNEDGRYNLPDKLRDGTGDVVSQPTVLFTAQLSKDGVVVASATSLTTIWGPKAWEIGESIARGRLYDSLGLSMPGQDQSGGSNPNATGNDGAQGQSKVVPIGNRQSGKPAAAAAEAKPAAAPAGKDVPGCLDCAHDSPEERAGFHPEQTQAGASEQAGTSEQPATESGAASNDDATVESGATQAPVEATSSVRVAKDNPNGHIESNLLRQIEVQASSRGAEVPVFKDQDEAKAFYRDLLKGKHDRKAS